MANTVKKVNDELTLPVDKYELAKNLVAKGASDSEFELLVYLANKYRLDPLLKEIWFIKRRPNEAPIIMTRRDGYLAIAHRSGQFDGMQSGTIENEQGRLEKAWCEVWRKDMSHSFKAEVRYSEYVQPSYIWQKYPSAMLIKVAEVFALKRAFSISGMLTQEEVGYQELDNTPILEEPDNEDQTQKRQLNSKQSKSGKKSSKQTASDDGTELDEQMDTIYQLGEQLGLDRQTTKETVEAKYKLSDISELSEEQAEDAIQALRTRLEERESTS
jgi:phage recombination protein Bet